MKLHRLPAQDPPSPADQDGQAFARIYRHAIRQRDGLRYVTLRTIERSMGREAGGARARRARSGAARSRMPWTRELPPEPPVIAFTGAEATGFHADLPERLVQVLAERGFRVGVARLCDGEADTRRLVEAGAVVAKCPRDYGYESLGDISPLELHHLFDAQMADVGAHNPDIVFVCLSSLTWHPDTRALLRRVAGSCGAGGAVLSADSVRSAVFGLMNLESLRLGTAAVMTLPSVLPEVAGRLHGSGVPAHDPGDAEALADAVLAYVRRQWLPIGSPFLENDPGPARSPAGAYGMTG